MLSGWLKERLESPSLGLHRNRCFAKDGEGNYRGTNIKWERVVNHSQMQLNDALIASEAILALGIIQAQ